MGTKVYDNALDLITFSRNSGGTSLRKISYGDELVTNSGQPFVNITGWESNGSSLSVVSSRLTWVSSQNATYLSTEITGLSVGSLCVVTLDAEYTDVGNIRVSDIEALFPNILSLPEGTTEFTFIATATTMWIGFRNFAAGATISITSISVREVLFDQPDGTLQLFNHPADIPRIDYSPDGTAKGLLIEEQRTNNVTNSEACEFADQAGGTVTASTTSAPYGMSSTVKRIQSSVLNGGGRLPVTILTGGDNCCSVYVRSRTGADQNLKITASGTVGVTQVAPASGDWVRLDRVASLGAGQRDMRILSVGDAIDIDIALPQVEAGAFPTSYIPTSGSTVTRASDVASIPVSAFGYNQEAGTVFVNANPIPEGSPIGNQAIISFDNGTVNDEIILVNENNDRGRLIIDPTTGAGNDVDMVVSGAEGSEKYAAAWTTNDAQLAHGGTLGAGDTSTNPPKTITQLNIGSVAGAPLNGHIKSIQYFPRRLTNAQLQELTQ